MIIIQNKPWKTKKKTELPTAQLLGLGYLVTILIGTILLYLPISSQSGHISFIDALFTATSATCVTGLVPFSTTNYTIFGQIVILCLIQIGGLGFMTIITLLFMLVKKQISLYNRTVLLQSAGGYTISGIPKFLKRIIVLTAISELFGTLVLTLCFLKEYSFGKALYFGLFHAISAFCNAGFDLFGTSLVGFNNNIIVMSTIMLLIQVGGIGFIVWSDIIDHKFNFKNYELHSKIVLVFNLILVFVPTILFLVIECTNIGNNLELSQMSFGGKLINSFFMAITPRTAGFNSIDLTGLSPFSKLLTMILMFIGGASGSTAGGLKITTFVIVIINMISLAKKRKEVTIFKRSIPISLIKMASALFIAYITLILFASMIITTIEPNMPLESVLFECISAIATVGLSLGLSSTALVGTKIVLIALMFSGRIGAFALFDLILTKDFKEHIKKPEGKVLVG